MKARHFRVMYQNAGKGVVHTVSVADTTVDEKCNIYYIAGLKGNESGSLDLEEKFVNCAGDIDLMVVANHEKSSMKEALELAKGNKVKTVILPGTKDSLVAEQKQFLEAGVKAVQMLESGESLGFEKAGWKAKIVCVGMGEDMSLAMFHDTAKNDPKEEDCVLTVRPFSAQMPSEVSVDAENLSSDMRGTLYNDFNICKGHTRNRESYVTGTILLGNLESGACGEVLRLFDDEKAQIRFVVLPEGGANEASSNAVLDWMDHKDELISRYFIIPTDAQKNEGTIKELLKRGARHIPLMTGSEWGHQASGFFVKHQ